MFILISYDLNAPGQNYTKVKQAIEQAGFAWCRPLDSVWIVEVANGTQSEWQEYIRKNVDANDSFLVTVLTNPVGGYFSKQVVDWLQARGI